MALKSHVIKPLGSHVMRRVAAWSRRGGVEGQGKGRGIGNTYGVQEQGARWGRLLLMSVWTPDLRCLTGTLTALHLWLSEAQCEAADQSQSWHVRTCLMGLIAAQHSLGLGPVMTQIESLW